jgi:hypothetical protein
MNELSNLDIDLILKRLDVPYNGCEIAAEMTEIKPGNTIINLNGNSHWVCLIRDGNKYWYFDSYGFPSPEAIEDLIGEDYNYSKEQLQSINSSSCGYYCCAFLKFMQGKQDKDRAYKAFLDLFSNQRQKNEVVLYHLLYGVN